MSRSVVESRAVWSVWRLSLSVLGVELGVHEGSSCVVSCFAMIIEW